MGKNLEAWGCCSFWFHMYSIWDVVDHNSSSQGEENFASSLDHKYTHKNLEGCYATDVGQEVEGAQGGKKILLASNIVLALQIHNGFGMILAPITMRNDLPSSADIKVHVPDSVTTLNLTSRFEWYVDWLQERMSKSHMFKRDWIACS